MRFKKFAAHGTTGQCTACGSQFIYGEIWRHEPTGEHIHLGHICGAKYGFMIDRSEFEMAAGRAKQAAAAKIAKKIRDENKKSFCDSHPGLEDALKVDHYIINDISHKLSKYGSLTDKQVALVMKIAAEQNAPKICDHCGNDHELDFCPNRTKIKEGKRDIIGTVLTTKVQDGYYGDQIKMLVLVESTGEKLWGTVPAALLLEHGGPRGKKISFRATIKKSDRDDYFGFAGRPTKAVYIK
jgi:hypothetical protein